MPERLYVLVPPSLGKGVGGRSRSAAGSFDGALGAARAGVRRALAQAMERATEAQLGALFSARGDLLERSRLATRQLLDGTAGLLPAWRRYQGVVWSYLEPHALSPTQRRRLLVPSGLYGLLDGADPIADYRLKMNVSLPSLGVLSTYWRRDVTDALIARSSRARIVNLLPAEHAASVDWPRLRDAREVIDVRFVAHDESAAVGHDAKAVKGTLAQAVLRQGLCALDRAEYLGWRVERRGAEVVAVAPTRRRLSPEGSARRLSS